MPWRWVVSPFGSFTFDYGDSTETKMVAKVATLKDPTTGSYYQVRPVMNVDASNRTWALCLVQGVNLSAIDADSQIINLFEGDVTTSPSVFLDMTPTQLGWNAARLNRIRNTITAQGGNITGLTSTTPIRTWLTRLGQTLDPNFNPDSIILLGTG
jgi:hypothetical protein